MTNKMPKPAFQIILGALLLTFAVASCNGSGDTKTTTDTTTKTVDTVLTPRPPTPPIDTTKMDTATTRPVKTPDKAGTEPTQ